MRTIKLPSVLPGDLDLTAINRQLKEKAVQLDWRGVESASDKSLAILLFELDLSDDADVLGIEGEIADNIAGDVIRFFNQQDNKSSKSDKNIIKDEIIKLPEPIKTRSEEVQNGNTNADSESPLVDSDSKVIKETQSQSSIIDSSRSSSGVAPSDKSILTIPSSFNIREELERAVLQDLLGPAGGEDEEIDEQKVSDRYLVGLLAPIHRKNHLEAAQDEELAVAGEDSAEEGITDLSIPAANSMMPSSLGMTFCVSGDASAIKIIAGWGQYDRLESEYITTQQGNAKRVWKRKQIRNTSPPLPLKDGQMQTWVIDKEFPDVFVQGLMRKQGSEWIISLFFVNGRTEESPNADKFWVFQPEMSVISANPDFPDVFVRRPKFSSKSDNETANSLEDQAMDMLYRNQVEFAVGHGVSVHTEKAPGAIDRAIKISVSAVPAYEVPKVTPPTVDEIPELSGLVLDMKELAESSVTDLVSKLNPITIAYEKWIKDQEQLIKDPSARLEDHQLVATSAIASCYQTLGRIRDGLELLQKDNKAAEAFQFMNRAMWQQRIRSIFSEKKRRDENIELSSIDIVPNRSWFPFQLAFILLNLPSITDLHHEDRCHPSNAIADLLWFPTGGGKTEAYLGLTAFTLGLRRLQGTIAGRSGEYGIAVLMRYTLRLLTLQQFQRATALICACEMIRRESIANGSNKWGKEPFRIGLWVGRKTTPNKTSQSQEFMNQSKSGGQTSGGSPHQLTNCPWCGTKIEKGRDIDVRSYESGSGRTLIYCSAPFDKCLFNRKNAGEEGLPVVVVDEEIYRRLPSLLISTVDKFAQMPWNGATQMLFGQVEAHCERHGFKSPEIEDSSHKKRNHLPATMLTSHNPVRPPDLIIQDELHLISGPLGTLVGLYETVVDKLSSWEVDGKLVRPKVVASTATIRQAKEQVHNLFLRQVQVFPPQGLDVRDNFFARQRTASEKSPGRRYLGICAPGRRLTAALIRVYVAILSASQSLYEKYGTAADPWMTLVGYFNSLRELAGMRRYVDDQIKVRLAKMDRRGLKKRLRLIFEELTSRRNSTDIPKILDALEIPFDPKRQAEIDKLKKEKQIDKSNWEKYREPIDILLATNMLSVGVDVKRLGVMVVANQPKNTAEYIQASSRVGRSYPGLVITVFNWARPRDLSHYETFEQYHATFYKHVEALSLTPFASGALERGLAALFISLIRLSGREFNENVRAGRIDPSHPYVTEAIKTITDRAWLVGDSMGNDRTRKYVEEQLKSKLDYWVSKSQRMPTGFQLGYQKERDGVTLGLLEDPFKLNWQPFTCLKSLRNVEPTINLILHEQYFEEESSSPWKSMDDSQEQAEEQGGEADA